MPQRITTVSVTVYRDGKRQFLKPNTKFDFTEKEIKDIAAAHKGALRKPNSDADDVLDLTQSQVPKAEEKPEVEVADTTPKPLTAAEKKKQAAAEAKAKLAEEKNSSDADEGDL